MADELDDGEFWLPQFLTDDDLLMEKKMSDLKCKKGSFGSDQVVGTAAFFPFGFGSFGPSSDLGSPVESSSTETESDEEDYLAGLTWAMARSSLQDDFGKTDSAFGSGNSNTGVLSGSPQSTLCDLGVGCGCRQGSSRGSPNGPSQVSSSAATWDLLYAAAGEVARMRMKEEGTGYYPSRGLLGAPCKPAPPALPIKNPNCNVGIYYEQSLPQQQRLQAAQIQHLKLQHMMKQRSQAAWGGQTKAAAPYQQQQLVQNRARNNDFVDGISSKTAGLSLSAWPPLQQHNRQQQNGTGMRAVFLDTATAGAKRGCAGTGVFLPRRVGSTPEMRKKPGCSTVLLPAKVVQALNLNLNEMGTQTQPQSRLNGALPTDGDAALMIRSSSNASGHMAQQKRSFGPQPVMNNEILLPQEWTY